MSALRSPVFAIRPTPTLIDFPGRMAGVFFFAGCNLRCGFCHNASFLETVRPEACLTWAEIDAALDRLRDQWADAVVLTGGEPTLAPTLPDVIRRCREHGMAVKLDTNGTRPDRLASVVPDLAYVAMDVKASPDSYPILTGWENIDRITKSLRILKDGNTDYEVRTTVIEPVHDNAEMDRIATWIRGARRWILQPFLPRDNLLDPALRAVPRTRPQRLEELCARYAGFAGEIQTRE